MLDRDAFPLPVDELPTPSPEARAALRAAGVVLGGPLGANRVAVTLRADWTRALDPAPGAFWLVDGDGCRRFRVTWHEPSIDAVGIGALCGQVVTGHGSVEPVEVDGLRREWTFDPMSQCWLLRIMCPACRQCAGCAVDERYREDARARAWAESRSAQEFERAHQPAGLRRCDAGKPLENGRVVDGWARMAIASRILGPGELLEGRRRPPLLDEPPLAYYPGEGSVLLPVPADKVGQDAFMAQAPSHERGPVRRALSPRERRRAARRGRRHRWGRPVPAWVLAPPPPGPMTRYVGRLVFLPSVGLAWLYLPEPGLGVESWWGLLEATAEAELDRGPGYYYQIDPRADGSWPRSEIAPTRFHSRDHALYTVRGDAPLRGPYATSEEGHAAMRREIRYQRVMAARATETDAAHRLAKHEARQAARAGRTS